MRYTYENFCPQTRLSLFLVPMRMMIFYLRAIRTPQKHTLVIKRTHRWGHKGGGMRVPTDPQHVGQIRQVIVDDPHLVQCVRVSGTAD